MRDRDDQDRGDPVGPEVLRCAAVTQIPEAECEVLAALFSDTDGVAWTDNTGWLETNRPCSWFGVICSGGQVAQLDQRANGLTGSIPSELGNLSSLDLLDLRNNQLTGPIPPELGNLSNLALLFLGGNQLAGTVPPVLGNLSKLTRLFLGVNQLTGTIPPELGNLLLLEFLSLRDNQLEGLVPFPVADLGGQLQSNGLNRCRFEGNPGLSMPESQDYLDADLDSDGFICGVPVGEVLPNAISLVTIAPPVGTTLFAGQVVSFTAG